jgi:hypothetical protein
VSCNGYVRIGPSPVGNLRHVLSVLIYIFLIFNELVANSLLGIRRKGVELRHSINRVTDKMEMVHIVADDDIKWRHGSSIFFVSADTEIAVVSPAVGQPVDQPGRAMIGKDNGLIGGENGVKVFVPTNRVGVPS